MDQPNRIGYSWLWITALSLTIYSVALTFLTGDIGFEGDDWWVFSVPYWHSVPESLWVYTREFLRPIEGIYWIGMFEVFGFNRIAFHLFSLVLLTASSILFGACLANSFPERRPFIILSVLFSFFLPTVCCLTYIVFTDNNRLCSIFFWGSVLLYQRWVYRGCSWWGLVLPGVLYVFSFLTYESCSLLIVIVPLLLVPLCKRLGRRMGPSFFMQLAAGISAAFAIAMVLRFSLLSGGAVVHNHVVPPITLFLSYLGLLPFYLAAPFHCLQNDPLSWATGIAVAALTVGPIAYLPGRRGERRVRNNTRYAIFIGLSIFILGMLPYQLAAYGSVVPTICETFLTKAGFMDGNTRWFSFDGMGRIYSSASFGIAIIFAAMLTAWKQSWQRKLCVGIATVMLGCMVAFHVGLRTDWKEAAEIRNDIVKSLITQVPNVTPNTNLVLVDLESNHKRAAVFRGWIGLRCLVNMLYNQQTVNAWYLYPHAVQPPNTRSPKTFVSQDGLWSRGMQTAVPERSLIILKRQHRELVMLDRLSENDGHTSTGVSWVQRSSISTNKDRIVAWADIDRHGKNIRNAWATDFISIRRFANLRLKVRLKNRYFESVDLGLAPTSVPR